MFVQVSNGYNLDRQIDRQSYVLLVEHSNTPHPLHLFLI